MDQTTFLWLVNGLIVVLGYFLKTEHTSIKSELKAIKEEVSSVRDTYFKKEDFQDFKRELWARLDRIEDDIKAERAHKT